MSLSIFSQTFPSDPSWEIERRAWGTAQGGQRAGGQGGQVTGLDLTSLGFQGTALLRGNHLIWKEMIYPGVKISMTICCESLH